VAVPTAAVLSIGSRWRPAWKDAGAVAVYIAAIGAVVATVSGIIDHFPHEQTSWIEAIEEHQKQGLATTAGALVAAGWRFFGRRKGKDPGAGAPFAVLQVLLVLLVLVAGKHGGDLVYGRGVGVDGVEAPAGE
jgi:uncharacterized membrane protein